MYHPFIERLISACRREFLDQTLFWNGGDLLRKLNHNKEYYNSCLPHSSLEKKTPDQMGVEKEILEKKLPLKNLRWKPHCCSMYELPDPAS